MTKFKFPKRMPHLEGALRLTGPRGMCFHRTVGLVLDVPRAQLCVGIFREATEEERRKNPEFSDVPFLHCWAEIGSIVYAPTTIEATGGKLYGFNRAEYYEHNQARNIVRMKRARLLQLSKLHGLADHLLYFKPLEGNSKFASVILDDLGVKHIESSRGGVIPGVGKDEPL
jgi:hypothetical protein